MRRAPRSAGQQEYASDDSSLFRLTDQVGWSAAQLINDCREEPAITRFEIAELACLVIIRLDPTIGFPVVVFAEIFSEGGAMPIGQPSAFDHKIWFLSVQLRYIG